MYRTPSWINRSRGAELAFLVTQKQRLKDLERLGGRSRSALNELFQKKGFKLKEEKPAENGDAPTPEAAPTFSEENIKKDEL
jgi:hypothetical protein